MDLPAKYSHELNHFVALLSKQLGDNLYSLVVYGSAIRGQFIAGVSDLNILVILRESTPEAHSIIASMVKSDIDINPFIITQREMARSFQAFALKFESIRRNHEVIFGEDPFAAHNVDDNILKFSTEQSLRNLRLRSVRAYVLSSKNSKAYQMFLLRMIPSLFVDLSQVLRLEGQDVGKTFSERIAPISSFFDLDEKVMRDLLSFKDRPRHLAKNEIYNFHSELFRLLDKSLVWIEQTWPQQ